MTEAGTMFLLPPAPDKCQECAVDHSADQPHNAQSLFYQVHFQMQHSRSPNWIDAMAHCSDDVRAVWTDGLTKRGVDVAGGGVNPEKGRART